MDTVTVALPGSSSSGHPPGLARILSLWPSQVLRPVGTLLAWQGYCHCGPPRFFVQWAPSWLGMDTVTVALPGSSSVGHPPGLARILSLWPSQVLRPADTLLAWQGYCHCGPPRFFVQWTPSWLGKDTVTVVLQGSLSSGHPPGLARILSLWPSQVLRPADTLLAWQGYCHCGPPRFFVQRTPSWLGKDTVTVALPGSSSVGQTAWICSYPVPWRHTKAPNPTWAQGALPARPEVMDLRTLLKLMPEARAPAGGRSPMSVPASKMELCLPSVLWQSYRMETDRTAVFFKIKTDMWSIFPEWKFKTTLKYENYKLEITTNVKSKWKWNWKQKSTDFCKGLWGPSNFSPFEYVF